MHNGQIGHFDRLRRGLESGRRLTSIYAQKLGSTDIRTDILAHAATWP